jgi:hypothetical protein
LDGAGHRIISPFLQEYSVLYRKLFKIGQTWLGAQATGVAGEVISYTVQHVLVLRLLMCYPFQSVYAMHNLLFLVSAEKADRQQLGFYDFIRTRAGAYSRVLRRIIEELKREKLLEVSDKGVQITPKGKTICENLGSSLGPFSSFWTLCADMVARYGGDPESLNRAIFNHLVFRRAKLSEYIFLP